MEAINKHGIKFTLSDEEAAPILADQAKAEALRIEYEAGAMDRALEEKHTKIDEMRDKMIARGFVYDFPDQAGTIQLRHDKDMTSVTGVGSGGMANILLGDTDEENIYKDKENWVHIMTNLEAVAMGKALKGWILSHYRAAWTHKVFLGEPETVEEIEGWDISVGWPLPA